MDAADEFSNIVDYYDAMRADLAELRHEARREFDRINGRMDRMDTRLATKAELAELRSDMNAQFLVMRTESQTMRADFQAELRKQTQWTLGVLVTILVAIFLKG